MKKQTPTQECFFNKIASAYDSSQDTFDETINLITNIEGWSIFKRRPNEHTKVEYIYFDYREGEEHYGLQFLLMGILSVYYDSTINSRGRPGFTAFPSGRKHDVELGSIDIFDLR